MPRDFYISGAPGLRELARRCRAAGRADLRTSMTRRIRSAAQPAVDDLRAAARAVPIRGSGSSGRRRADAGANARNGRTAGLRETIARAIKLTIRTGGNSAGARIFVNKDLMPPGQRNLPEHTNSRWRHPTFGHSPWTNQYGQAWWWPTLRRHQDDMRTRVRRVLDDVANRLD